MPIYEYACPQCHHIFEDWCKSFEQGDEPHPCPECATQAERIISQTSFALKGSGWYATEYGTMKQKPKPADQKSTADANSESTPASKPDANTTSAEKAATTNTAAS